MCWQYIHLMVFPSRWSAVVQAVSGACFYSFNNVASVFIFSRTYQLTAIKTIRQSMTRSGEIHRPFDFQNFLFEFKVPKW